MWKHEKNNVKCLSRLNRFWHFIEVGRRTGRDFYLMNNSLKIAREMFAKKGNDKESRVECK